MIQTIEIRFLSQPLANDSFSYTIRINGSTLIYPGSNLNSVHKNFGGSWGYPTGINIGNNLGATLSSALTNLNAINHHPAITYAIQGNSIFVTIQYTGTISVEGIASVNNRVSILTGSGISFITDVAPDKLRMAYNNDIIKFYSDYSLDPLYCTVRNVANNSFSAILYPAPDNSFYFNFKGYASALINTHNFNDWLEVVIDGTEASSYVYDFTDGTYLSISVDFEITYTDKSTKDVIHTLHWLAGVEQIGDNHYFSANGLYVLSPFRKLSANNYYIKYWQGYPFDMALYATSPAFTLYNDTNLLSQAFGTKGKVNRLVFSDGRTDETLEDILPLSEGYNNIRITNGNSANDKFLLLEKLAYKSGVYLKWLNKYGGYSYWLFEDTYSMDRSTKQLGEIDRDNDAVEDAYTRTLQLGKESQDTIRIIAELLNEDERRIVEGLLDSPKIWLFTGQPYARSSRRDWTEVSLKTTGARLKNAKQPLTNFAFDLELPQRFTQRL